MKNNTIYSKNIQLLKLYFHESFKKVTNIKTSNISYSVFPAIKGNPTIEVIQNSKKVLIHSRIDPVLEAKRFIQSNVNGDEDLIIVFGLGLGYHIEELINRNTKSLIIIIEPSIELFNAALKTRDLSKILKSEKVNLLIEPETLDYDNFITPISNVKFIIYRPYMAIAREKALEFKNSYKSYTNRRNINTATLKRFDRLWTKNTFKNAKYFFTLNGISSLRGKFKGLPAIVIGAGPSVEKVKEDLINYKKDVVLIAVDTAFTPLLKMGIVSDFVVTVDPQLINSYYLRNPIAEEIKKLPILVADPSVHPITFRNYTGKKLLTSSVFTPGKLIEKFSGEKGNIAAGGSVATAAFDLARIIGADPIVLIGLDLSYKDGKTHLSGSLYESYILSTINRFNTSETIFAKHLNNSICQKVDDKNGKKVFTDKRMWLYKSWFEDQIQYTKSKVINATEDGLHIEGIEDISLKEVMEKLKNKRLKSEIDIDKNHENNTKKQNILNFIEYLTIVYDNLQNLKISVTHGKSISKRLLKFNDNALVEKMKKELDKIDKEIMSYNEENLLIGMVIQSSINDVFKKANNRVTNEAIVNSYKLYSSLEDGTDFLSKLIRSTIKRMNELKNFKNSNSDQTHTK